MRFFVAPARAIIKVIGFAIYIFEDCMQPTQPKRSLSIFPLLAGLLIGTALGGAGATAMVGGSTASADEEAIKAIVRETIKQEPQLILDSVQAYQIKAQQEKTKAASNALKDPAVKKAVFNTKDAPFVGPEDSDKVVVEFFDYNCPACKMQFRELDKFLAERKDVKVIFKEYPIFGPQSETNAKIALAVSRLAPEKYFAFHSKMMGFEGRAAEKDALQFAKDLGLNPDKVKSESQSEEVAAILDADRELGAKLNLQGTPTLIVGEELVPHALGQAELTQRLK